MIRAILILFCATAAQAQSPVAARIENGTDPGTCTAALLAPDLVLTAAHCLHPAQEGYTLRPAEGVPQALGKIYRHPVFALAPPGLTRFRFDVALADLASAVDAPVLPVGPPPIAGERLAIETWRRDTGAPQQRQCTVLDTPPDGVVLDCEVSTGHSGAPVLRITEDGPEVIAVLVAQMTFDGRPAALGVTLHDRIEVLMQVAGRN